jgi:hypothetical protein
MAWPMSSTRASATRSVTTAGGDEVAGSVMA